MHIHAEVQFEKIKALLLRGVESWDFRMALSKQLMLFMKRSIKLASGLKSNHKSTLQVSHANTIF